MENEHDQQDQPGQNTPSRILRDLNRKRRVILVIVGDASVTLTHPKITLSEHDDLIRVATALSSTGLAVVQTSSEMLMPLHTFAELLHVRIYAVTDLPDLQVHPTDQLLLNRYEPVSYHELGMVFEHINDQLSNPSLPDLLVLS